MNQKLQPTDFGLPAVPAAVEVEIADMTVQIMPRIPYEQVLEAVQWSINYILDDRTFVSAPLRNIVTDFALVRYYSNIATDELDANFVDISTVYELYDILAAHDIPGIIRSHIEERQLKFFLTTLTETLDSLVAYANSAAGIIDRLQSKSGQQNDDMTKMLEMINNDEQMATLRNMFDLIAKDPVKIDHTALPTQEA